MNEWQPQRNRQGRKPPAKKTPPPLTGRARANAALLKAAAEGDYLGARFALEAGADVNARDTQGRTPLMRAIFGSDEEPGSMAAMEEALRSSAERLGEGVTPVVQLLLRAGAHVNVADKKGFTPLLFAVTHMDATLCKELLRRKANVNFRNASGLTPLVLATMLRNPELVDLFLKAGADPKRHGMEGKIPLLALAVYGMDEKKGEEESIGSLMASMMGTLLGMGGDDQLIEAVVERLLRAGVDPNEKGEEGFTPLMAAAGMGSPRLVRRLLDRGAKVDAPFSDGSTALFVAAEEGRPDNARVLLQAGANPNASNQGGETPLMLAAEKASYALVERLLAAGAKLDARRADGKTARDLAASHRHTAIVKLLDARAAAATATAAAAAAAVTLPKQ